MSDSISRQDAIDAFGLSEKTRKYGGDHSGYNTMMLYEIQDILEGLPSADRPQEWIPCSEKLPSENGDYLVTLENGVVKILGYSTTQRTTYPKGFYHIKDGFSWRQIQNPVVAWMPLPEPYKGVNE